MAVNAQEGDFLLYDTGYSEPIALQRASAVAVILPLTDLNAATRGFIVQARHGENWYTLRGDSEVTDLTDSTGTALLSGTVVFALPADIYPLGNIRIATVSSNTTLAIQTHSGTVTCGLFLKET